MRQDKLAHIFLICSILLGAMVPVALGFGTDISIPEFLFLAAVVSTITTFVIAFAKEKLRLIVSYMKNPRDLGILVAIGLLQYAVWGFGFLYAERVVSVALAAAVYRTSPLLMLLFIPYFLRERITKFQIAALVLAFAGLYFALSGGNILINGLSNAPIMGLLFMVALSSAFTSVMLKKYMFEISSSMFVFSLANMFFFGALLLSGSFSFTALKMTDLLGILYMGVIGNALLGIIYYSALRMLKTTFVTNLYFLSPFITFIYSAIIFGEAIQPYYILIALLVGTGLLIQKFDLTGGKYVSRTKGLVFFDVTSAFINTQEERIQKVIKNGGKVLAVKLHAKHREKVSLAMVSNTNVKVHLFTELDGLVKNEESLFIREIMGADEEEMILMAGGNSKDSEMEINEVVSRV